MGFGSRNSIGVAIGQRSVSVATMKASRAGWRLERAADETLSLPLFAGPTTPEATNALAETLLKLIPDAVRRYIPVHVTLPDAMVQCVALSFDELPKKRDARMELVRWRLNADNRAASSLACAFQGLKRLGDKHLVLGLAVDEGWRECVRAAFAQVGITPWSMNSNLCRQFNRFYDHLKTNHEGGALLVLTSDAWSLLIFDEEACVRYTRARWRALDGGDDGMEISAEIERSILAFVRHAPEVDVKQLYIVTDEAGEDIASALDHRLRSPCIRLPLDEDYVGSSGDATGASAAWSIAAAIQQ